MNYQPFYIHDVDRPYTDTHKTVYNPYMLYMTPQK